MRLAFYLDDGLVCGGAERVACSLLRHWSNAGWEVHLISRRGAAADFYPQPQGAKRSALMPARSRQALTNPQPTLRWLPGRSLLRFVLEAMYLRRHLKAIAPDVAVAFLTPGNTKLLAAASGLGCRVVVSERTDLRARRYPLMWRVLRRLFYPRADLVSANTPGSLDVMAHYVSGDRLVFLPNPVDLPADEELAYPESSRRIVCAGRLIPDKRHLLAIEAFALLDETGSDWHLDILGDGPLRHFLAEEIRRLGLQDRIILHGNVHDVTRYFREAAIFILPSAYEGTPNALLEAMAHALPCVVSDSISCAKALVADTGAGVLFSSGNAADLAEKLATLTADPAVRRAMGRSGSEALVSSPYATAYLQWDEAILRAAGLSRESPAP